MSMPKTLEGVHSLLCWRLPVPRYMPAPRYVQLYVEEDPLMQTSSVSQSWSQSVAQLWVSQMVNDGLYQVM